MLVFDQLRRNDRQVQMLSIVVLVGMGILLGGLYYVQILSGKRYQASQVSQSFRTVRIPAIRGKILDTAGRPLSENRPSYNVNLYLEELRPRFQTEYSNALRQLRRAGPTTRAQRIGLGRQTRFLVVSNLVHEVTSLLGQPLALNEKKFRDHYDQHLFLPMPVLTDLPLEQVGRFVERLAGYPGIDLEVNPVRVYPRQTTAAHLLGYLRRDDAPTDEDTFYNYRMPDFVGVSGIEGAFDRYLRGSTGIKSVLVNSLGFRQSENTWTAAEPGRNVHLTLDTQVQEAAERALRSAPHGTNTRGAIVVLDVRNGDLLALASSPTLDPNAFVPRLGENTWTYLQDTRLRPLINRATYGAYHPGSVFKVLVGIAALEAGTLDPNAVYHSKGYYELGRGQRPIGDLAGAGEFDFKRALIKSSNPYFIQAGLDAGVDRILDLGQRACLGELTGIPTLQETRGIFPTRAWQQENLGGAWFDGNTANLCIGQGEISVTPLQVAVLYAAIANGGTVFRPRLVSRVDSPDPLLDDTPPQLFPAAQVRNHLRLSRRTISVVHDAMVADTESAEGTGTRAQVPGYRICGKTGTAQIMMGRRVTGHTTWFASFAPYGNPRYAVVVMVEGLPEDALSGGGTCAPVARQVYLALQKRDQQLTQPGGSPLAAAH